MVGNTVKGKIEGGMEGRVRDRGKEEGEKSVRFILGAQKAIEKVE